jgi:hypothetical protein
MAKKADGTKKPSVEILDDNGTLIASSARVPGANAGGPDSGDAVAEADKRDIRKR